MGDRASEVELIGSCKLVHVPSITTMVEALVAITINSCRVLNVIAAPHRMRLISEW